MTQWATVGYSYHKENLQFVMTSTTAQSGLSTSGKTIVFKYGGSAMADPECVAQFVKGIGHAISSGIRCVIVHGGGPEIDRRLMRLGIEKRTIRGLRVTDEATMEIVEMALSGKANKALVAAFMDQGIPAVGVSGRDGGLLTAVQISEELGRVGKVTEVDPSLIWKLLEGFVPVIATVASDSNGAALNINADLAASAIAVSLEASKLILLTDTNGVRRDPGDAASVIACLNILEARGLIDSGIADRGMIPKLEAAIEAIEGGVESVLITDGRGLESFLESGPRMSIGTLITAQSDF